MHAEIDSLTPSSLEEALAMLANGRNVLPIAGGTNIVVGMREGEYHEGALMELRRLPELDGIHKGDGYIVLGGGTTISQLLASPLVRDYGRPLHQAASAFANPLVRNRATVAGNVVDASPAADTAPPLLALDAELELRSAARGSHWMPLDEFLVGVNKTRRQPDELIVSIRWPLFPDHSAGAQHKLALRKGTACSVLSAAVVVHTDGHGVCTHARVALGAVAVRPMRAYQAEEALVGQALSPEVIEKAARLASEAAKPIDDVRSTADYRKRMCGVLVRRLLTQLAGELG